MTTKLETELNDIFHIAQVTRGTFLESLVAADVVLVEPVKTSQVAPPQPGPDGALHPRRLGRRPGRRARARRERWPAGALGKRVYHGVRTFHQSLRFLSVQSPPILDKTKATLDLEQLVR